jgi:hypothetical protein
VDQTDRLIGEVAARYGIRLDPDDPAFALVAMNQLALEDAVGQLAIRMKAIAAELEKSAESVGLRAGIAVAEQIRNAHAQIGPTSENRGEDNDGRSSIPARELPKWVALGMLAGLIMFGLGLLVGARLL